jgi:rhodanese-related sulfurtransferase/uncharacterized membrane protein YphA (DoxX/SURF4 family)
MNSIDYFSRKSSIAVCFSGTIALVALSMVAGLTANKFSRHPFPLNHERKAGIENIELERAVLLQQQKTLFVDARSPDVFNDGHIPGAFNFDYFNFDRYFMTFSEKFNRSVPFVVYCEGVSGQKNEDTCETSGLLAQQLFERGYRNVTVFEEGFAFWEKGAYAVERGAIGNNTRKPVTIPLLSYFRDFILLVIGIFALFMMRKPRIMIAVQMLLGAVFIISGSSKLFSPEKFAVIIEAYRIVPATLVPFVAVSIPWLEFFAGFALVTGLLPSSGALVIIGMHLFFIPALLYRALFLANQLGMSFFGVDFDCGCGLGENFAWVLILRDAGFLLMGLAILGARSRLRRERKR